VLTYPRPISVDIEHQPGLGFLYRSISRPSVNVAPTVAISPTTSVATATIFGTLSSRMSELTVVLCSGKAPQPCLWSSPNWPPPASIR